ncbi:MAG: rhamnulokinase family protein [Rubrobacteraceae bacterium]
MTAGPTFLAVDLGAESGRVLSATLRDGRVDLEEIHRFPNEPVRTLDGLHWDVLGIFAEIKKGLREAAEQLDGIESVGIDSWAVDFALLARDGSLISNPHNYRDARTEGMIEHACERVSREEIYQTTGTQFMRINTLYQLLSMKNSPLLEAADGLLLIPDLISYWLTGRKACEFTNATTTQLYDLAAGDWAWDLIEKMSLPARIFPEVLPPATELGTLLPDVAEEVGIEEDLVVLTVATHDTASAVAAVPGEGQDFAYISSGTWSLVGVETPEPVVTPEAMDSNFTNEGGVAGRTRFLKNVMGLWLLQECRKTWAVEGSDYSYEELQRLATEAPAFGPVVDPDHPDFFSPGDMPSRIGSYCEATGQEAPASPGATVRCVLESLALKYHHVLREASRLTGREIETIHVVGGGSLNSLLCQLTADAAGTPVLAGPVEATAIGNAMVQALARGYVESLEGIRATVRRSYDVARYEPGGDDDEWEEQRERFRRLMGADLAPVEGGEDA